MKKRNIIFVVLLVVISVFCLSGCDTDQGKEEERQYTNELMQALNDKVGMPNIQDGFMKKSLKMIYELQDDSNLVCYAYSKNAYTGKYTYLYPCIGFGIPYTTQYTSPDSLTKYNGSSFITQQADPDGLYHGSSTQATWVLRITEKGEVKVVYAEEDVHIEQEKLPRRLCDESTLPADY